jgi:hypothetical protein
VDDRASAIKLARGMLMQERPAGNHETNQSESNATGRFSQRYSHKISSLRAGEEF